MQCTIECEESEEQKSMSENKRESLQKKMAVTKPVDLVVLAEYEKDDDNLEYVMLPKDITRRLYSDTIELTIERTGEVVRIQKNQIQVGSHSDCDLRLNDMKYHTSVARRQATFYYENNTWFLRDDTVNGSWINDIRMEKGKNMNCAEMM